MTRVLLASPISWTVSSHFCGAFADLLEDPIPSVEVKHQFARGGPRLANQRNLLVRYFLEETTSDYLLFVDSDIKFTRTDLETLLDSRKSIVGARSYGYSEARDETFPNWQ